ncbi:hypothetical protein [uncultured Chryseobacterium sp.]|jgi:hypothetical protein|uniref:hypothetical protein n=1 Tax=uncultured Chryseobacterium sp. TaxID=259322 RepID=UPI00261B4694|nr:hypothetical protein [uncultured Chryseobacterium sp.]
MSLSQNQRIALAAKIIRELKNYEYEVNSDANEIILKDDKIEFKIIKISDTKNSVEIKFNGTTIIDDSSYWDKFYTSLQEAIEEDVEESKRRLTIDTTNKLNVYLGL